MRFVIPAVLALALPALAPAQIPTYQRSFAGSPDGDGRGRPRDLAVEPAGTVIVVDAESGCLHRFAPDGTPLGSFGGIGTEPGRFSIPTGVAVDPAGDLWVAEVGMNRVQKLTPAGTPLMHLGQATATGASGPGRFDGPTAVTVAADGSILVADTGNHRIQKFAPDGAHVATFGSMGSGPGQFHFPEDVWAHGGRVFVLDRGNLRIQVFEEDGTHVTTWGRSGSGDGRFHDPTGLAVAADGTVHVVDAGAFRVQVFGSEGAFLGAYGALGKGDGDFVGPVAVAAGPGAVFVADQDRRDVLLFDQTTPVSPTTWGGLKLVFASGDRR